ncbi:Leucine rich repeat-containing protein [Cladophialophora immunda]|nr:Leucine rich repeat-containing protein [Cladophialophora immunda]
MSARSSPVPNIHHDELRKTSHIPRPLGENVNQSIRSRYGWLDKPVNPRSESPVRDALRDVQITTLDTTPPGSSPDLPVFETGNENPTASKAGTKHRTQQISPTPSSTAPRPDSPTKRPFRPPGRISPTKDMMALPPVVSPGEIYTPPKAFVKGVSWSSTKAVSSNHEIQAYLWGQEATSPTPASKQSLSSLFRVPSPTPRSSGKLAVSNVESPPALLKPRSRGENSLAPSTPPSKSPTRARKDGPVQPDTTVAAAKEAQTTNSPKSSAALRETIAKAKAAKRKARESAGTASAPPAGAPGWPTDLIDEAASLGGDNKGLLRKRIQQAVTSGHLNIAAMKLKQMPSEVMKMYESENSMTNWAEMVDLIKLNAADNELNELEDDMFPDFAESELADDDEKRCQFGGLETIDLRRNRLRQIPMGLRRLERLQTLNLSGNKISNNAFEVIGQIPHLKELVVADNLIEGTLELGDCKLGDLQVLDLRGNKIQSFGAEGLTLLQNLKVLNITGNKFSTLSWESLPTSTLAELNISRNCISGILLPGALALPELRILDASFNGLEKLFDSDSAPDLPNLRSLTLNGNKVTGLLSLTNCSQLYTLDVSENQLEEIPLGFTQLENLKTADFGNNNIRLVSPEIATMVNLSSFNIVGNPLREKKYLTMSTSELKTELEKKLEVEQSEKPTPELNDNHIDLNSAGEYHYAPTNGILDLSSHSLATLSVAEIDLSSPIHTLKLSNNELTSFPVDLLSHPSLKYTLQSLDLSHNPQLHPTEYLTSELFLPNLKSFYIVSTGLTSLDALTTYLKAPCLTEVNISCHRLAGHVPWVRAWWPNVNSLLATDNWFSSVDVEGVRGLEVLDIRNNEIESLPPKLGLLGNLPGSKEKVEGRLRVLEVSGNRFRVPRITVVEKGTEAVLRDLRRMVREEELTDEWRDAI